MLFRLGLDTFILYTLGGVAFRRVAAAHHSNRGGPRCVSRKSKIRRAVMKSEHVGYVFFVAIIVLAAWAAATAPIQFLGR